MTLAGADEAQSHRAIAAPLITIPQAPLPPGGEALFVTRADGARLRVGVWPLAGARASVLILPGRAEFIEKYAEVIGELRERNCAVGIIDWRGQGLSDRPLTEPLRGHIDDFKTFVDDFLAIAVGPFGRLPKPWLLLCHSMGGTIGAQLLSKGAVNVSGAIFSVPMFGILTPGYLPSVARAIAATACAIGWRDRIVFGSQSIAPDSFEKNILTHDATRFATAQAFMVKEPKLALGPPTFGWLNAAFAATEHLARSGVAERIATPSLFLLAKEEGLTDNAAAARFAARMPRAKLIWLTARHEILMERDIVRGAFWREYDAFVAGLVRGDVTGGLAS